MEAVKTPDFEKRMVAMRDERAKARIAFRVMRLYSGNAGDAQPVGEGVCEMRIHYGPGYSVYYKQRGMETVILLLAGTKKRQSEDVALAKRIASNY